MKPWAWMMVAAAVVSGCSQEGASTATADTGSGQTRASTARPGDSATAESSTAQAPAASPAPTGEVPEAVDGANVTMGESEVDGLKSKAVSCKSSAGVFASMAIVGALAKKKDELVKCGAKEPRVHFSFKAGKTTVVGVTGGEPEQASCIAQVVASATFPDEGACVMTLLLAP